MKTVENREQTGESEREMSANKHRLWLTCVFLTGCCPRPVQSPRLYFHSVKPALFSSLLFSAPLAGVSLYVLLCLSTPPHIWMMGSSEHVTRPKKLGNGQRDKLYARHYFLFLLDSFEQEWKGSCAWEQVCILYLFVWKEAEQLIGC